MTRPSPRETAPAGFSVGEAIAGGALTLAAYLVTSFLWYWLVTVATTSGSLGTTALGGGWVWAYFVWIYGAMTALPAAIVGTATASLIGRAMRDRASFPRHLLAQAANAYLVGALATVVCLLVVQAEPGAGGMAYYALLWGGPAAAISALIGWRSIVAIARRRDRRRAVPEA